MAKRQKMLHNDFRKLPLMNFVRDVLVTLARIKPQSLVRHRVECDYFAFNAFEVSIETEIFPEIHRIGSLFAISKFN